MTEKLLNDIFDENYKDITNRVAAAAKKSGRNPDDIMLLAATKTVCPKLINYAIKKGIKYVGENRVQEFLSKEDAVDNNVHKHFIGHLQTNKVKDIVGKVELIQSVDSVKLATVISKESLKRGIVTDILLEVNIGMEESKSGFSPEEVFSAYDEISNLDGIRIKGLMTIPPHIDENNKNTEYFFKMYKLFIDIRTKKIDNNIEILSMGMSDDFETAIECGANMVRVGTALFGKRNY